jgi:hypothetical protein
MPGGTPALRGLDWFVGGPVGWYFLILYVGTVALAAYVVVDASRPVRREWLAGLPEPAWLYQLVCGVFLALALVGWVPPLPRWVAVIPVVMTPFALGLGVAYLLRVVFPKPRSEEGDGSALDVEPADDAASSGAEDA